MKTKLRNIIVDNRKFVYWYSGGEKFVLIVSPKEDKNIKVTIIFEAQPPEEDPYMFWAFYELNVLKDNKNIKLNIAEPKFIGEVIEHLMQPKHFFVQKSNTVLEGRRLLQEMGFSKIAPVWVREW